MAVKELLLTVRLSSGLILLGFASGMLLTLLVAAPHKAASASDTAATTSIRPLFTAATSLITPTALPSATSSRPLHRRGLPSPTARRPEISSKPRNRLKRFCSCSNLRIQPEARAPMYR